MSAVRPRRVLHNVAEHRILLLCEIERGVEVHYSQREKSGDEDDWRDGRRDESLELHAVLLSLAMRHRWRVVILDVQ
jgi:hypothetical protein